MRILALNPFRGYRGLVSAMLIVAGGWVTSSPAHAQSFTWNQPVSGGDWLSSTNWLLGGPPNAGGAIAIFGNAATGTNSVMLSSGVTVGEIHFLDVNTQSSAAEYTIGVAGQLITLNNGGSPGLINVAGITSVNQTIATNLSVVGSSFTINNNGAPGVNALSLLGTFAGSGGTALNIGGQSNTTIGGAIGNTIGILTKTGTGELTLSGANAYTGGTVITGGIVAVGADNNLGGPGNVTLNGGTLRLTQASFSSARQFNILADGGTILAMTGSPGTTPALSGAFTGTGRLTFDGGSYVNVSGNSIAFTGVTFINNAGVSLLGNGNLPVTAGIIVNGFVGGQIGILSLDNISGGLISSSDRVSNTAPVILNGGLISIVSGFGGNANEDFGPLTVQGFGTLYGNQLATFGGTASMIFDNVTRADNFSTLYVGGPVTGPGAGSTAQIVFTGFTAITQTGQTTPIIPWIGGDHGNGSLTATGYAETFYTYTGNGLFALDATATAHFVQIPIGGSINGIIPGAKNNAIRGDPAAVNTAVTVLSLAQNPAFTEPSTIIGTGSLTVTSGAIANINQMVFAGPTLSFGGATGYIWLGNEMAVSGNSRITNANGLVVSSNSTPGRNTLYLFNTSTPNNFTGGLYLNGSASVGFDSADSQLGAAGGVISFRGGTLRYLGGAAVSLSTGGLDRPLQMTAAGGGAINVEDAGGILTVPGLVSGDDQLTKLGPGTLVLANPANTYKKGTTLNQGTIRLGGAGSLGLGSLSIGDSGNPGTTLAFDFSGTVTNPVRYLAETTFNTGSNNVTLSGVVSGTDTALTKSGTGTLTLAGDNTFSGNLAVTAGTVLVTNSTGSGTGYGPVSVQSNASLGGTGTIGGPVSISGGNLIVGPGTGPGTLTVRGKTTLNATSTFRGTLAGTTAGSGYSQLVVQPGGSLSLGDSTLNLTLSYVPTPSDMLFIVDNRNPTGGLTGTFAGLAEGALVSFPSGTTARIYYGGDLGSLSLSGGNDVVLGNFVPVPEPVGVIVLAAAGLAAVRGWRRRTNRAASPVHTPA